MEYLPFRLPLEFPIEDPIQKKTISEVVMQPVLAGHMIDAAALALQEGENHAPGRHQALMSILTGVDITILKNRMDWADVWPLRKEIMRQIDFDLDADAETEEAGAWVAALKENSDRTITVPMSDRDPITVPRPVAKHQYSFGRHLSQEAAYLEIYTDLLGLQVSDIRTFKGRDWKRLTLVLDRFLARTRPTGA